MTHIIADQRWRGHLLFAISYSTEAGRVFVFFGPACVLSIGRERRKVARTPYRRAGLLDPKAGW